MTSTHHHVNEAIKVAPAAGVSVATLFGYPVSELILWLTLIYTLLMIAHKVWQIYRDWKQA